VKKIIVFTILVLFGLGTLQSYAEPVGDTSLSPKLDTTILGVNSEDIYVVSPSTIQATNVLSANENRKGYTVTNLDGSNAVYKATYPATASDVSDYLNYTSETPVSGLITIDSEYSDNIEAYTGDIYIIGVDTGTRINVIEKY